MIPTKTAKIGAVPQGADTPLRDLTHSLDRSKEQAMAQRTRTCTIDGCENPYMARGWCSKHWQRWRSHGDPTINLRDASIEDRFFTKFVEGDSGCWLWIAGKTRDGYGVFADRTRWRGISGGAHRWSYEFFIGEVPASLQLDHLCRVRHCVNPWHLDPVTPRVNSHRGESFAAAHARATRCVNGHPFDDENTYHLPGGGRSCRACNRAGLKRTRAKKVACAQCGKVMTRGAHYQHRKRYCPARSEEDR